MSRSRAQKTRRFFLLVKPEDRQTVLDAAAAFGPALNVSGRDEHHFEGADLLNYAVDFLTDEGAKIYLGYLVGKNVTFTLERGTGQIVIRNLPDLLKILRKFLPAGYGAADSSPTGGRDQSKASTSASAPRRPAAKRRLNRGKRKRRAD